MLLLGVPDFLDTVADKILEDHGRDMKNACVVLPGKRAGLFLKNKFRSRQKDELWLPKIEGINEFIESFCPFNRVDRIQLLFTFFEVFKEVSGSEETFDQFIQWAPVLISDFDDVDRYLGDTEQLFKNLRSVKELEDWPIDDWSYENDDELPPIQRKFAEFWDLLPDLYHKLNKTLGNQHAARGGLCYRYVAEHPEVFDSMEYEQVYFCGLNALSKSEISIIKHLKSIGKATVIWDVHPDILNDPIHEAGYFLRKNIKELGGSFNEEKNGSRPDIHVYSSPNNFSQSLIAASLLNKDDDYRTAIVMCNENILEPMQKELPELTNNVNITTELPLDRTIVHDFFQMILNLNIKRIRTSSKSIYYKDLFAVIQHPAFNLLMPDLSTGTVVSGINRKNIVFINESLLKDQFGDNAVVFSQLFNMASSMNETTGFIKNALHLCDKMHSNSGKVSEIIREQLFHQVLMFNRIKSISETASVEITLNTLQTFFRYVIGEYSLSFRGEPLKGIQIMGMLETRSINFDKVIFVNANEGDLPQSSNFWSFIPYDLRMYFNLPGKKNKEAIHSYYFYRQLWRAKEVHIIYNADKTGFDPKEPSRYIHQLKYEHWYENVKFHSRNLHTEDLGHGNSIKKDDHIKELIRNYFEQGISPSSINTYLNCQLDFFHKYILRLREMEESEEQIKESTFGTILHDVLDTFYAPIAGTGKLLDTSYFTNFEKKISVLLEKEFETKFFDKRYNRGKNNITYKVCFEYLRRFITTELNLIRKGNSIEIKSVEESITVPLNVNSSIMDQVVIKGKIDRVDIFNGTLRIMDYKSGSVKSITKALPDEVFTSVSKSKELQLMVYAWIYAHKYGVEQPHAGIFYLRKPSEPYMYKNLIDAAFLGEIENNLRQVIENILNTEVNFIESQQPEYTTLLGYSQ